MRGHGPPLAIATLLVMAISAYHPVMVGDWLLENLLVVLLLAGLGITYRRYRLSNTSYWMIFLFLCVHEWGAHHKYADVPLGEWMKTVLQTNRNHYDRVAHFAFGVFFAYPFHEVLYRWAGVRAGWQYYLPIEASLAVGAVYEIVESIVARIVSPEAGEAFVGLQGDMWDAQKDIALAGLGATITVVIVFTSRTLRHSVRDLLADLFATRSQIQPQSS
jgi:putative membrane protein